MRGLPFHQDQNSGVSMKTLVMKSLCLEVVSTTMFRLNMPHSLLPSKALSPSLPAGYCPHQDIQ